MTFTSEFLKGKDIVESKYDSQKTLIISHHPHYKTNLPIPGFPQFLVKICHRSIIDIFEKISSLPPPNYETMKRNK